MAEEHAQVLVVGGGPSGLATALFLARQGIDVLLVERDTGCSAWPRATHVTRRTMELLRPAGVEDALREVGMRVVGDLPGVDSPVDRRVLPACVLEAPTLRGIAGAEVLDSGAEELAVPGPTSAYWCGQDLLEPILAAHATHAGARIRFGTRLVHYTAHEDGVSAVIRDAAGEHPVRARYLVGADGSRSTVRPLAGIGRTGHGLLAHRASILFDADLDRIVRGRRFFVCMLTETPREAAIMELNGRHRWAVAVAVDAASGESAADLTPDRCRDFLRVAIGADVDIRLRTVFPWQVWHRVADRLRSGPVFLAGDAAHIHAPAGGYGSNVGMQDAHNLAWKLAWVLRGWAGEDLLDTYSAERLPVGAAMADQTTLLAGVGGAALAGTPKLPPAALVYGARYASAAVLGGRPVHGKDDAIGATVDRTGTPGTRMPHLWLRLDGRAVSPHDLCPHRMLLVTDAPAWCAAADRAGATFGVPVCGVRVDPGTPGWAELTGSRAGLALLVRPDGVVAWRGATAGDPGTTLARLLRRVLALDSAAHREIAVTR
ncbi:MAG TPA: FAD-dependent oxidoreductase [Actinophytocola sp.]|uniref:FAD-dependent oxidoreductase n=1 Tax=Actinophytocola sp. TaxID=1872138 RepID=UPI002DBC4C17|nr:FAD-dependent oxidoreductase [Actinophytocola sp.]HEU5469375.1 FAD-dependent oxidoreductase [Actinophytocola sp.]